MKYQPVGKIWYQTNHILRYLVASKSSKPGQFHIVTFKTDGTRDCKCVGHEWLQKRRDDILEDCRHKKLVTIFVHSDESYFEYLKDALKHIKDESRAPEMAWAVIMCQQPDKYNPSALRCEGCKLYPEICNIHKIYIKRNKLPLVWKLQGQIFSSQRTAAAKTIRQIIKEVEKHEIKRA